MPQRISHLPGRSSEEGISDPDSRVQLTKPSLTNATKTPELAAHLSVPGQLPPPPDVLGFLSPLRLSQAGVSR